MSLTNCYILKIETIPKHIVNQRILWPIRIYITLLKLVHYGSGSTSSQSCTMSQDLFTQSSSMYWQILNASFLRFKIIFEVITLSKSLKWKEKNGSCKVEACFIAPLNRSIGILGLNRFYLKVTAFWFATWLCFCLRFTYFTSFPYTCSISKLNNIQLM